jgi:signal transduction histidine kinase
VRAQIKVVILVAVVVVVTLVAIILKTQTLLLDDKLSFINDSNLKQLAPLKHLVSDILEKQKDDLVRFATAREAQGAGRATAFGNFDAIALVEPAQNAQWVPAWIEKGPTLRAEQWTEGYDLTLLKSLPYAKVKDGSSLWVRLSDSQGAPLYAILNSVEVQAPHAAVASSAPGSLPEAAASVTTQTNLVTTPGSTRRAVIVGFVSENPLASVTEDYIGSTNSVYVVDDRGYVASHVKNSYLGTSFADDKLTQEMTKTAKISDTKETTDMDGQKVIGHFERIEHTNLAAVITTPVIQATAIATRVMHTILLVGGAVGILGLLMAYLIGATFQMPEPYRRSSSLPAGALNDDAEESRPNTVQAAPVGGTTMQVQTRHLPSEVSPNELVSDTALAQDDRLRMERRNAFEAFNAGLAARLREPLLAILGHAQLAKSKSTDSSLIAHAESIEREARLAKEAIERFQIIEESSNLGLVPDSCDLEKVVLSALAEKAIEIEGSGIALDQKIVHVPRVRGRANDVESMVVHILENSLEALRDRSMKKMTIHLSWLNDCVRLLISDSGIGMTRDVQAHAFEPFYKGFEAPRHMGLGLAFVHSTMKRMNATYELESSLGEGTVFTIEFPVEPDAKKEFEASTAAPGLQQINDAIGAFTLGGRRPLSGPISAPTPPPAAGTQAPRVQRTERPAPFEPGTVNEFTISSITNPGIDPAKAADEAKTEGFRVKIRRPKPRGSTS